MNFIPDLLNPTSLHLGYILQLISGKEPSMGCTFIELDEHRASRNKGNVVRR